MSREILHKWIDAVKTNDLTKVAIILSVFDKNPQAWLEAYNHPLIYAVNWGSRDVVSLLIERGEDPNMRNPDGNTLLGLAVQQKNLEMVDTLISLGANINKKGYQGSTPLMMAAFYDEIEIAQTLLDAGADKGETYEKSAMKLAHTNRMITLLE